MILQFWRIFIFLNKRIFIYLSTGCKYSLQIFISYPVSFYRILRNQFMTQLWFCVFQLFTILNKTSCNDWKSNDAYLMIHVLFKNALSTAKIT
jgi:hypothetical protein